MASRAERRRRQRPTTQPVVDATPERISKSESEFINPAKIDSSEQRIGLVRRFRSSHLDRLRDRNRITWVQWYAGDWYRNQHARCRFALSVVASYGEHTSAGELSYGLPRTEAQARARQLFRQAKSMFPLHSVSFMERLLIDDELPCYGGRASLRNVLRIAEALDALADWLMLPVDNAENSCSDSVSVKNCALRSAA